MSKMCEINTKDSIFEPAIKMCTEAIQIAPERPDNYVYLGLAHRGSEEPEKAKDALKRAANKFVKSELALFTYANLLEKEKNYIEAYKYYTLCSQADHKSARCWLGLGLSAFEIKRFDEALTGYSKACQLDRKNLPQIRKATAILRNSKNHEWANKYDAAGNSCGF